MDTVTLILLMFGLLLVLIFLGHPVAFALGAVGLIVAYFIRGPAFFTTLISTTFSVGTNFVLVAIPLFIFMGNLLRFSGIAERLYDVIYVWTAGLRGSLAVGTVIICTFIAAMAGNVGAGTLSVGTIALESMKKYKYNDELAMGSVMGAGTLAVLIPPSIIFILYAGLSDTSTGRLFAGGVFPGLMLAGLFIAYVLVACKIRPDLATVLPTENRLPMRQKLAMGRNLILPIMVIVLVLGSIFTGIATPTEAAAVGVVGVIISGLINRTLSWRGFKSAMGETIKLQAMVFWIIVGAGAFTNTFSMVGASSWLTQTVAGMAVPPPVVILMIYFILIILGMFIDQTAILLIAVPVFVPIAASLGYDLIWFGIVFTITMQIGYLSPPFGYSIFYMKALASPDMPMARIYRAGYPFIFVMILCLVVTTIFPQVVLWLPNLLLGGK